MSTTYSVIRFLLECVILAGVLQPTTARAYDGIGGDGGTPFRVDCGEWGILVGVIGRAGAALDQVGGLCVKIDPISGTWVGGVYETRRYGGNGGGTFRKICPVGQALWGIEGITTYIGGSTVAGPLNIDCIELAIQKGWDGRPEIKGSRMIFNRTPDSYRAPDPYKVTQDICDSSQLPKDDHGHYLRIWGRLGLALEGRAGKYVDRIHIVCNSLAQSPNGYHVEFRSSAKTAVPEGTPLQISWRASGVKPELTPNLQYSWELFDDIHTQTTSTPIGSFTQPRRLQDPCVYALQPCAASWLSASSGSAVIFNALPPAAYVLRLTVRPTVSPSFAEVGFETKADTRFEITPNRLVSLAVTPGTIRAAGVSTATITLEGVAPPRGTTVYLSSSNPQFVSIAASIVVPGGRSSATVGLRADPKLVGGAQIQITASLRRPINLPAASAVKLRSPNPSAQAWSDGTTATAIDAPAVTRPPNSAPSPVNQPSAIQNSQSPTTVTAQSQAHSIATQFSSLPSDTKQATLTIQRAAARAQRPGG